MAKTYGTTKFAEQWKGGTDEESIEAHTTALKEHWAKELAFLSNAELNAGYKKMKMKFHTWPPTLPEFIELCRPHIDPLVAYYEAIAGLQARRRGEMGEWSHPAIFWAASSISCDLMEKSYSQVKANWEYALNTQLRKDEWEIIRRPELGIPAPGNKTSREEGHKRLVELKELLKTMEKKQSIAKRL